MGGAIELKSEEIILVYKLRPTHKVTHFWKG